MWWKGKELEKIGDLSEAMWDIANSPDAHDQAQAFMRMYRLENEHADENIGYLCGYFGNRLELQRLFGVTHPFFGDREVTPEEAFEMGKKLGEQMVSGAP